MTKKKPEKSILIQSQDSRIFDYFCVLTVSIDEVFKRYNSMNVQLENPLCWRAGERKTEKNQQDIDHLILFHQLQKGTIAIITGHQSQLNAY